MKRVETPSAVSLEPAVKARAAVIWLHGLGADGHDFVPIVPALRLGETAGIRFIFPHAPVQPVTLNGGLPMRSWFDILSLDRKGLQDKAGIARSATVVRDLIASQIAAGIPSTRIVIAGFSQGGALALHTALRFEEPLAGLIALSTYLPLDSTLAGEAHAANRSLPILLQHGLYDPILPHSLGTMSRDVLLSLGYPLTWNEYPMQHEVCDEEIDAISVFLKARLA